MSKKGKIISGGIPTAVNVKCSKCGALVPRNKAWAKGRSGAKSYLCFKCAGE